MQYIKAACQAADKIICAWGVGGRFMARGEFVQQVLGDLGFPLHHLGLTKDGHPRFPLYLRNGVYPQKWGE